MKKAASLLSVFLSVLLLSHPLPARASLSAGLGATNLHGLDDFTNCQNQSFGYREKLIADRLELKLANTPKLSPEERSRWAAEIAALRRVAETRQPYAAPDPRDSQHYLLGLTDREQVAVNSMASHYSQQINIQCESRFGGMSQFSNGGDRTHEDAYVRELQSKLDSQTVQTLDTIPVEPLGSGAPQSRAEKREQQRADLRNRQQQSQQMILQCAESGKGLRPKLVAQALEKKLQAASGLSDRERADFQADINAAYAASGRGLDRIEPVDPQNPARAEQRLTMQEQMDVNNQYVQQYSQMMQTCAQAAMPPRQLPAGS